MVCDVLEYLEGIKPIKESILANKTNSKEAYSFNNTNGRSVRAFRSMSINNRSETLNQSRKLSYVFVQRVQRTLRAANQVNKLKTRW